MWGRAMIVISTLAACGSDDGRADDSPFGSSASASASGSGTDTSGGSSSSSGGGDDGSTTGPGTTSGGETSTSSTTSEQPLPCDPEFVFDPPVPTSAPFVVEVFNPEPLAYISLTMTGPTVVEPMFVDVVAEDPWAWQFSVTGQPPGIYTLEFGNAESEGGPVTVHSTCQLQISG